LAFFILTYAGLSDLLDGALARVLGQRTKLGAILDPTADKLLMFVSFLTLGWAGALPIWLVVMVIFRDLLIVTGIFTLKIRHKKLYIRPTYLSKMTTFFQLLLLFFCFGTAYLSTDPFPQASGLFPFMKGLIPPSMYLTSFFTVLTGIHYTLIGFAIDRGRQ